MTNFAARPAGYNAAIDNGAWEKLTPAAVLAFVPFMFFVLANIYDMGGTHGLKYISYLLLVLLIPFARRPLRLRVYEEFGIVLLFLVWPACSLFMGLSNGADIAGEFGAISQTTPFLGFFVPLLVVPILGAQRVLACLFYAFVTMAIVIAIVTPLEYMGWAMGFVTQIPNYCSALYEPYHGGIGEYRLYFQATLWLVPSAIYFARTARFALAMLCLAGLIMASSRSGALIAFLFIVWIVFKAKRSRLMGILGITASVGLGVFLLPAFLQSTRDAFLGSDGSALLIRYGHAVSVMQIFAEKPWTIFIGAGAGATFYSNGTSAWEVRMETDHLDAVFHYGILWFSAFTGLCVWTIRRLLRSSQIKHQAHGLAMIGMYFASGTNPQLISPLFMFYLCSSFLMARPLGKKPSAVAGKQPVSGSLDVPRKSEAIGSPLPSPQLGWEG